MLLASSGSGVATLVGKVLWDKWKAPDEVRERVEDRFVLKETCQKCEKGNDQSHSDLRGYVEAVDEAVKGVRDDTKYNSRVLTKIAAKLKVEV
jgi:hypothetical protein